MTMFIVKASGLLNGMGTAWQYSAGYDIYLQPHSHASILN